MIVRKRNLWYFCYKAHRKQSKDRLKEKRGAVSTTQSGFTEHSIITQKQYNKLKKTWKKKMNIIRNKEIKIKLGIEIHMGACALKQVQKVWWIS